MLNAVHRIDQQLKTAGSKPALVFPKGQSFTSLSFADCRELAARVQTALVAKGLQEGQSVLIAIELSPLLYASIIACARLGLTVTLVEPWMPLARIEQAVGLLQPKAFLAGPIGRLWGLRVAAIRKIPHWLHARELSIAAAQEEQCVAVDGELPCIITFTSGSTGVPKGVVRSHAYLGRQQEVVSRSLQTSALGPDLVIFANMALENLAHGRCSVIVPSRWPIKALRSIDQLPSELSPQSLVGGPSFLRLALNHLRLPQLKAFFIGGALSDCALFESALSRWPEARSIHVYGSTEAEPVAFGSMRDAVAKSRAAGYYQVLFCGQPTEGMSFHQTASQTWIAGPHVCPEYLGDEVSNLQNKKRDESGTLWHRMGDRIIASSEGWWYAGREQQAEQDFYDEQRLYTALQSSDAMIARDDNGGRIVYCSEAKHHRLAIQALWTDTTEVRQAEIKRDRRHRARIDREATRKGRSWIVG